MAIVYIKLMFKFYSIFLEQNYFRDAWNIFDFIIVLGSIADIIIGEVGVGQFSIVNFFFKFKRPRNFRNETSVIYLEISFP